MSNLTIEILGGVSIFLLLSYGIYSTNNKKISSYETSQYVNNYGEQENNANVSIDNNSYTVGGKTKNKKTKPKTKTKTKNKNKK